LPAQQLGIPLHLLQHWPFNKRRCKKIAGSTVGHPSIPSLLQTSYSSPATAPLQRGTHHFQLYSAIQTHHTILSSSPTDAPATVPFFQRGTYLQVRLSSPATVPLQGGTHRYNCFHPSLLYSAIPLISSVHHLHYTFSSKSSLRCTRNRPLLPVHVYGTSRAPSSTLQSSPHRLQPTFHQNQAIHTTEASFYCNIQA
jgi:hypothetical protein